MPPPPTRASTTCTTRSSTHDASAARSTSSTPSARGASSPRCASAHSTCSPTSRRPTSGPARPTRCSRAGSSTAWSSNTSTSTTRRCSPRSSSWTASPTPTPTVAARHRPRRTDAVTRPCRPTSWSTAARSRWAPTPGPGSTTTSGPPRGHARAVPDRHHGGHEPVVRRVPPRRRLRRPAPLDTRRVGLAAAGRPRGAGFLDARRCRRLGARAVRTHRGGPSRRAGATRVLVRGRRLRPLGRGSPADRGGMGARRPRHRPARGEPLAGRQRPASLVAGTGRRPAAP